MVPLLLGSLAARSFSASALWGECACLSGNGQEPVLPTCRAAFSRLLKGEITRRPYCLAPPGSSLQLGKARLFPLKAFCNEIIIMIRAPARFVKVFFALGQIGPRSILSAGPYMPPFFGSPSRF